MSSFGLLSQGFVLKTVQDLLEEIEQEQRQAFGPAIDTTADSVLGQLNGVVAGQLAQLWEVAQALSAAVNPDFASGAALDAVAAISGAVRLPATPSLATLNLLLNDGTSLPAGRIVSVGATGPQYETTEVASNSSGQVAHVEVAAQATSLGPTPGNAQSIDTIVTPAGGWFANAAQFSRNAAPFELANGETVVVAIDEGAEQVITLNSGDFSNIAAATATEVANAINATLTGGTATALADDTVVVQSDTNGSGSAVRVRGTANLALGFPRFTWRGFNNSRPGESVSGGTEPFNLSGGETLFVVIDEGTSQQVDFLSGDFGVPGAATAKEVAARIGADVTGATAYVLGGSVVIESLSVGNASAVQVTGGSSNAELLFSEDAFPGSSGNVILGRNTETDADFRARRLELLTIGSAGTLESIRAAVRAVDGVEAVFGRDNKTNSTDSNGLPAKSFEIIAQGGEDAEIARAIFETAPAGILSHRDPGAAGRTEAVVDSEGNNVDINFTRPTEVPIYIAITVLTDPAVFGGGSAVAGEQAVKDAIKAEGDQLNIGDDVIALRLESAPLELAGVLDVTAFALDTSPAPSSGSNITIAGDSRATFSTANIAVTVTT